MASLRKISGCALGVAALMFVSAPGAHAATITVTTGADTTADDGQCSLREAINAANDHGAPAQGCQPERSSEGDQILLGSRTLVLAGPFPGDNDNSHGDLDIDSTVSLVGAGASQTKIDAQNFDRAIHVRPGGTVELHGLTVTKGRSPGGAAGTNGADGGGIFNEGGELTVDQSRVVDNVTGNGGGATAGGGDGGDGGGIYNTGSLTITKSVIAGNVTGLGGSGGGDGGSGGGIGGTGAMILQASTVSGNTTGAGGGGSGGDGGGIEGSGDSTIENSTIAFNQAAGSGGGVANTDGTLTLTHTTLAGNIRGLGAAGPDVLRVAGTARLEYSIAGGCSGTVQDGGGNLGTDGSCPGAAGDPRLGPLQANGGPTPTMALSAGSAAIDHIPAVDGACLVATDQRGVARPAGPACDAGAFEAAAARAVVAGGVLGPDETAPRTDQVAVAPATFAVGAESTPLNGTASARGVRSAPRGTTIRYRLSERADALLSIEQRTSGLDFSRSKRAKARCLKATRANKRVLVKRLRRRLGRRAAGRSGLKRLARLVRRARCVLYVPRVVLARTSRAGLNRVAFSGRIRRRALRRGRYRVVIVATDASDNRSKPARASFRIVAAN